MSATKKSQRKPAKKAPTKKKVALKQKDAKTQKRDDDLPVPAGELQVKPKGNEATRFKPGQSGNPAGRAKGSRNKLSEHFVSTLSRDFEKHGEKVISEVRAEDPVAYLKVVASLVPKDVNLNVGGEFVKLWEAISSGKITPPPVDDDGIDAEFTEVKTVN